MTRFATLLLLLSISITAMALAEPVEINRPQPSIAPTQDQQLDAERALAALGSATGSSWQIHRLNGATGTIHLAHGTGIDLGRSIRTADDALDAALDVVTAHPAVFRADIANLHAADVPWAPGKWAVNFVQMHDELRVLGGRADVCMTDEGRLFVIGSDIYSDIDVNTVPIFSARQAREFAIADLGVPATDVPREDALHILPVHEGSTVSYHLVYEVAHRTEEPIGLWISYVDAHDGSIHWRINEVRHLDVTGTVTGVVENPDYCTGYETLPLANMRIVIDGSGGADTTDADGNFSIPAGVDPVVLVAQFEGPWLNVNVDPNSGLDAILNYVATPGVPAAVHWDTLTSRWDERDCYYHGNLAHDWIKDVDSTFTDLDYSMPCAVGIHSQCNAFWDGTGINFYHEAGGCANTGRIGDVVYHEYGHGITDKLYTDVGQPPSDIHEGNSDIFPNLILNRSLIGNGFYLDHCDEGIRNSDNDLCWPEDMTGGGHHDGQLLSGFTWDAFQILIGEEGEEPARTIMKGIWHFGRKLGKPMFLEDQVYWTFVADDDNGNVGDGTPHWNALCTGATNHCFPCPEMGVIMAHEPRGPLADSEIPIAMTAQIYSTLDLLEPDSLLIRYRVDGGAFADAPLVGSETDSMYFGEIPAQDAGVYVEYFLVAEDMIGNRATVPETAPDDLIYIYVDPTFSDDFETHIMGWRVGDVGDTATEGIWERVDPIGTWVDVRTPAQPEDDHTPSPGVMCYVTGQTSEGGNIHTDDVDGGTTTLLSPIFNLSGAEYADVFYHRWYSDDIIVAVEEEFWVVQVRNNGGPWVDLENTTESLTEWLRMTHDLYALFGEDMGMIQFAFRATDDPAYTNVVEAAVDDFWIVSNLGGGVVPVEPIAGGVPLVTQLGPIVPNPLRSGTSMRYALAHAGDVQLDIYDVAGRHVRSLVRTRQEAGHYALRWDGRADRSTRVSAGVYFARLRIDSDVVVQKLTVIR